MAKLTFISRVKSGKLQPNTGKQLVKAIEANEGKNVIITIEKLSAKRSIQQNKYIHVMFTQFTEALNDLGNEFTMEEVKDLCKAKFALIDVVNEATGEVIGQRIQGTHEMKKDELSTFIDSVINWSASFFNIKLYYPNEEMLIDLEN